MSVTEVWDNLPDDEGKLPPCQFFISMEKESCDEPAPFGVLVKTGVSSAVIDLCDEHMKIHTRRLRAANRRKAAERRSAERARVR